MPYRGCQRAAASAKVMRWITDATESARMLYRRCQRAEAGHGDAMVRRGDGFNTDAASQMFNVLSACRSEAMTHEATVSARMLHRRCQRAEAGHGDAMDHRGEKFGANAPLRMSTR